MDKNQKAFLRDVQSIAKKFKATIEKYGYEEDVISSFFVALMVPAEGSAIDEELEDMVDVHVTYYMNAGCQEDIDMIKETVQTTYDSRIDPLQDLLNGTGIYLN